MIWLARKAFFGRRCRSRRFMSTPARSFRRCIGFRDHYGKEWELDLRVEPCPPIDAVDPTLPPCGLFRRAQDRGPQDGARQIRL